MVMVLVCVGHRGMGGAIVLGSGGVMVLHGIIRLTHIGDHFMFGDTTCITDSIRGR